MISSEKGRQHIWMDGRIQERSKKCKKKMNWNAEIKNTVTDIKHIFDGLIQREEFHTVEEGICESKIDQ